MSLQTKRRTYCLTQRKIQIRNTAVRRPSLRRAGGVRFRGSRFPAISARGQERGAGGGRGRHATRLASDCARRSFFVAAPASAPPAGTRHRTRASTAETYSEQNRLHSSKI
ncbi:hypothetical protein EVAR_10433_1 [Eumeta japonica]|uniref:Uncharacterized protein n=1 Tax=Eumeta variegata TaxID=151549 RepID=A0A4C1UE29_EUMVA|nr:hypothetical protein EVAR_10433_1 [Eumeta japonica]